MPKAAFILWNQFEPSTPKTDTNKWTVKYGKHSLFCLLFPPVIIPILSTVFTYYLLWANQKGGKKHIQWYCTIIHFPLLNRFGTNVCMDQLPFWHTLWYYFSLMFQQQLSSIPKVTDVLWCFCVYLLWFLTGWKRRNRTSWERWTRWAWSSRAKGQFGFTLKYLMCLWELCV